MPKQGQCISSSYPLAHGNFEHIRDESCQFHEALNGI